MLRPMYQSTSGRVSVCDRTRSDRDQRSSLFEHRTSTPLAADTQYMEKISMARLLTVDRRGWRMMTLELVDQFLGFFEASCPTEAIDLARESLFLIHPPRP